MGGPVAADDQGAVERLTAAGATIIRQDVQNAIPDHVVMADPEGNEFCVARHGQPMRAHSRSA
jgi:predicted enzyme related to lactoylglutathione lyase